MKRLLFIFLLGLLAPTLAVAQTWQWAQADSLPSQGLAQESAGNLYALVPQHGPVRWSVVVRDPSGALLRQFPVAYAQPAGPHRIAIGRGGRIYLCGGFRGQATFATTTLTAIAPASYGGYAACFSAGGQLLWLRQLPSAPGLGSNRILDAAGNMYLTGALNRTDSLGTTPIPYNQIWVARYDSLGTRTGSWRSDHTPGAAEQYGAQWVITLPDGSFLLHGGYNARTTQPSFGGVPVRPPQPFHIAGSLLVRFDRLGTVRWVIDEGIVSSPGVAVNPDGSVVLCVRKFTGLQQIGDSTLTNPATGMVLLKVDTSGHVRWLHALIPPLGSWVGFGDAGGFSVELTAPHQVTIIGQNLARTSNAQQYQLLVITADSVRAAATVVAGARFEPPGVPIGDMITLMEAARRPGTSEVVVGGTFRGSIPFPGTTTLVSSSTQSFLARFAAPVLGRADELPPAPAVLAAWPNPLPAGQPLRVRAPAGATALRLTNALGQSVQVWPLTAAVESQLVPVAGLAPGVYWLRAGEAATRLVIGP